MGGMFSRARIFFYYPIAERISEIIIRRIRKWDAFVLSSLRYLYGSSVGRTRA